MKTNRFWGLLGSALLVLALAALLLPVACAPAPAEEVNIKILTAKFGGATYTLGTALTEIINKNSPWLRATAVETGGTYDNIKRGYDDPNERRFALRNVDGAAVWAAEYGVEPYDMKYTGLKYIMIIFSPTNLMFTVDPNIKTPQDLIGKTVNMSARGSGMNTWARLFMDHAWGLEGKYNQVWLGYAEMTDALMDGTIDATVNSLIVTVSPDGKVKFALHPSISQPWELKPEAHFLGCTRAEFEKGKKSMGVPTSYIEIPAGTLGDKQPEALGTASELLNWAAYEMDDDVAYEIARVAHEHYAEFGEYHAMGKGTNPRTIAWLLAKSEAEVHPGALKYYKEHNVPVWVGGELPF